MTLIFALSLAACTINIEITADPEAMQKVVSPQIKGDEPIIGTWLLQAGGRTFVEVFRKDGSGYGVELADDYETRLLNYATFTWRNNADGTFVCEPDGHEAFTLTYDEQADTINSGSIVYTRLDPITGIWSGETTDSDGETVKITHIYRIDGIDQVTALFADGTTSVTDFWWRKNEDGTFWVSAFDGSSSAVWTISEDNKTAASSTGNTFTKRYDDQYYYLSVIGPWYNEKTQALNTLCADGTGKRYNEDGVHDFTWEIPKFGQFKITYQSGPFKDQSCMWTYDRESNVFITDDLTGESYTLVRPKGKIDGLTVTAIDKDAYIGQWGSVYEYEDGKIEEVVYTVNADGTAYFLTLKDSFGIQLSGIYADTWEKTGKNRYTVSADNGNTYVHTYDASNDTVSDNTGRVYTRLDPVVGIWTILSPYSSTGTDKHTVTYVMKSDGTGYYTRANEDGTIDCDRLAWTKNTDGTYSVAYGSGRQREWTISYSGYTLQSSGGGTKKKEFLDSCFLMSVTGAWYNEEKDKSVVFNGDGTGMINTGDRILTFNWELAELGQFKLTYTSGNFEDGSNAAGKESLWTYDRERNVLISSNGAKHTRVNKSVEGKINIADEKSK